jgi:hypothetical protein
MDMPRIKKTATTKVKKKSSVKGKKSVAKPAVKKKTAKRKTLKSAKK